MATATRTVPVEKDPAKLVTGPKGGVSSRNQGGTTKDGKVSTFGTEPA